MQKCVAQVQCNFCKKSKALYFCLECKQYFCENCAHIEVREYNLCGKCCSTNLRELKEKNDGQETIKLECLECGSLKVKKGKRKALLCPNCEKKHFQNISEYQHYLYTQYREFCNELKIALNVLYPYVKKLNWYKDRVLALRGQGYFTYPILEEKLLGAYFSFDTIKKKALDRESHYLSILRKHVMDFLSKKQMSPYMFKDYQEKLEKIELECTLYRNGIDKLLVNFDELFAELEAPLNILGHFREQFEKQKEIIDLEIKETPLCTLPGLICTGGTSSLSIKTGRGRLFITSQRMIFIGKKGILSKSSVKFFELPTATIVGCTTDEGFFSKKVKKLCLKTQKGEVIFSGDEKVLLTLEKYIAFTKRWQDYYAKESLIRDLERSEITISDLKQKIERDIQGLLHSDFSRLFPVVLKPRFSVKTTERVKRPKMMPRLRKKSKNPDLIKKIKQLKREKYGLLKTLESLEKKFRGGRMPKEFYLQEYRNLTEELYTIDNQLDKLKCK